MLTRIGQMRETKPTPPPTDEGPIRRIYGREEGCDVAFIACDDWRIPAHSDVLRNSNDVFRSMFSEDFFQKQEDGRITSIKIEDVDGRALDNLLRCLYGEPVPVQSTDTALTTLYAGHKYRCPELVNLCTSCLSSQLNDTNVLSVLTVIKVLAVDYQNLQNVQVEKRKVLEKSSKRRSGGHQHRPKGKESKSHQQNTPTGHHRRRRPFDPPNVRMMNDEITTASAPLLTDGFDSIESSCSDLLQTCLTYIDKNVEKILDSDEFDKLDHETLILIFSRNTLNIQDEGKIFEALMRWADQECKRQQLPLTTANKRKVLKEALFLPRYLTMKLKDFQSGPLKTGIFAEEEERIIQGFIAGNITFSQIISLEVPFFHTSKIPRCPIAAKDPLTKQRKFFQGPKNQPQQQLSFFQRIFRIPNGKCCQKIQNSQTSTPTSSNPSSPVRSSSSSPSHQGGLPNQVDVNQNGGAAGRRGSQTARINFMENIVVCFACLFD